MGLVYVRVSGDLILIEIRNKESLLRAVRMHHIVESFEYFNFVLCVRKCVAYGIGKYQLIQYDERIQSPKNTCYLTVRLIL